MNLKNNRWLWTFTAAYFVLAFVNIHFSFLAFICLITPFILLWRDRKKTWCQSYCPRASFLSQLSFNRSGAKSIPLWLTSAKTKNLVVNYFIFNLTIMTMSTTMVALGKMQPMLIPRFLILFPIPVQLPQLIEFIMPLWATHLSYRLFSMMMTTTLIGLFLAYRYRPRTWCAICPVATLSDQVIAKKPQH